MQKYKKIIDKYKRDILNLDHVVGLGYGLKKRQGKKTGEEAIVILVDQKVPVKQLNSKDLVPASMGDYRTDVIEVGKVQLLAQRTEKIRPAQPGVSIGHYQISAGTLGAVVKDKKSGDLMILSNNHVLANMSDGSDGRAKKGDPILQPGAYDNGSNPEDVIAHLERYIPIYREEGKSNCQIALAMEKILNSFLHLFKSNYNLKLLKKGPSNLVDCALARPLSPEMLDAEILEIGQVTGVSEPEVGMKIQKSGRTTGLTRGEILAVGVSIQVQMTETEIAVFDEQFVAGSMSKPGDSGSLVLDMDRRAVGLLFAGSDKATICNPVSKIMDLLEIEF